MKGIILRMDESSASIGSASGKKSVFMIEKGSNMNEKAIVIYTSKRGSTKQYAEWMAEDLGCEAVSLTEFDKATIPEYDLVIYGSWLRGSGIVDYDTLDPYLEGMKDRTVLFVTGVSEYNPANYLQICEINFDGRENMNQMQLYFCPGRYEPENVKGLDRMLMGIAKKVLKAGKTADDGGAADKMIERIENGVDLVDRRYTEPVLRAARKILAK